MKTLKPIIGLLGTFILVTTIGAVCADSFPEKIGYLIDRRGNVVKNSYGECWRTGYWTPAMAIAECDPDLVQKKNLVEDEPLSIAPASVSRETKSAPEKTAVAVVKTTPEKQQVVEAYFSTETLFDFDKAVVKPEGQKILEKEVVVGMKMHPEVERLIVTGHADMIGTEAYNQKLSERRANAVKAYLVKQGVAAERIKVLGKGESEPNPEANTKQACKGMRGRNLIACLQPDRRVTVVSQRREATR